MLAPMLLNQMNHSYGRPIEDGFNNVFTCYLLKLELLALRGVTTRRFSVRHMKAQRVASAHQQVNLAALLLNK
jgi:hypothetical protein